MELITFTEFFEKSKFKNQATSNLKMKEVSNKLGLNTKKHMKNSNFKTNDGIVNLQPTLGAHWISYKNECYFDFFGCAPSKLLTDYNTKRKGTSVFSECEIQESDRYWAVSCLRIIYLIKIMKKDFKSAVFQLFIIKHFY